MCDCDSLNANTVQVQYPVDMTTLNPQVLNAHRTSYCFSEIPDDPLEFRFNEVSQYKYGEGTSVCVKNIALCGYGSSTVY